MRSIASRMVVALTFFLAVTPSVNAIYNLGDGTDFAVLFEGAGNNHLAFNNGTISGNIGMGDPSGSTTAQLQLSGGAANTIIDGNVLFGGAVNVAGTAGVDYSITAGHTISGNNAIVQPALDNLNTLSTTLGGETGTSLAINIANGGNQTVSAASGTLDGSGNRVFTVSSMSFVNGATLTINGSASDYVVLDFGASASFGGTIKLTGGITSDHVLFNLTGGSALSGGPTLTISANGATLTGTFLDPNGTIQINHSVLDGRIFGGDTHDEMVVSGASIYAPVPEPCASTLAALGLLAFVAARRSKMFRLTPAPRPHGL